MLSWLQHLPADSSLALAQEPDAAWGLPEQLLAAIFDALNVANYQRAAGKGPKPRPLRRPGVGDSAKRQAKAGPPSRRVAEILDAYARGAYAVTRDANGRLRDSRGRFARDPTK